MKTKKLTPRNAAPVQRENTATVFPNSNNCAPSGLASYYTGIPFAGDDAE